MFDICLLQAICNTKKLVTVEANQYMLHKAIKMEIPISSVLDGLFHYCLLLILM